MIQFTPQMSLFLATHPADFRKGIDALIALCQQQLYADPFSGALFAFTNRRRTAIKLLAYDGTGFWLCLKRFSQGKLKWWPDHQTDSPTYHIDSTQLNLLVNQGNPIGVDYSEPWRRLPSQPVETTPFLS